jgi:type I restriction-modification system DNA methylase subunit
MARNTSSKVDSGRAQFSVTIGFELSATKDNMVALLGQFFYNSQIAVGLWFLAKNKNAYAER